MRPVTPPLPAAAPRVRPAATPAPSPGSPRLDSMLANLRELEANGPRVAGTESARRSAELLKSKVDEIGGWKTSIEALEGRSMFTGQPLTAYNVVADHAGSAPARSRKLVVAGAHHDSVPGSPGANDDGSGTVGLIEVARALKGTRHANDVRLVFFDAEEVGLVGSRAHVKAHAGDMPRTVAMIQAEMLGSPHGAPTMLFGGATPEKAATPVLAAARRLGVPLKVEEQRPVGSDHNPFADAGVPAMVISTTAPPGSRIMREDPRYHSAGDRVDGLSHANLARMGDLLVESVREYANVPARIGAREAQAGARQAA